MSLSLRLREGIRASSGAGGGELEWVTAIESKMFHPNELACALFSLQLKQRKGESGARRRITKKVAFYVGNLVHLRRDTG
jgi:hypothetical protein